MRNGQIIRLKVGVKYIYGLYDPADGIIRYVGRTSRPYNRLATHYYMSIKPKPDQARWPLYKWMCSLVEQGRLPEMKILATTKSGNANRLERQWIQKLLANQLVNQEFVQTINRQRKQR